MFKRIGAVIRAAIATSIGISAITIASGGGAKDGDQQQRTFTARLLELPAGRLLVGVLALVRRLGMIGYLGKGIAIGIVGILLGLAALRRNPSEAGGLDAALRTLAGQPFGAGLLFAVALGFGAYGIYCFAAARSHRT